MKKHKKKVTLNPKYLAKITSTKLDSQVRQRAKRKLENKEDFSKTYSDLMFKRDIGIHNIIRYLEKESKPED